MRKAFLFVPGTLLLVPAGGCSLFRQVAVSRQDSLQTASQKTSLNWKVDSMHSASRVFTYTDSSGAEFDVEIVPSGAFTFSAQGGFAGSASVVRLRGKSQTSSRAVDSNNQELRVQATGSLKQNAKSKTETTQKQREKNGNNSLWWWAALLATLLLVFVVIMFRRRFSYNIQSAYRFIST